MTGLDEELDVGRHEGHGHCHIASVGQDRILVSSLSLDTGGQLCFRNSTSALDHMAKVHE